MNNLFDVANTNNCDKNTFTSKKSILLFGEVLADVFPDKTILGGAPFNVARHLHAFHQNPVLISRIGNDRLGSDLLSQVNTWGMQAQGIQSDNIFPTGKVMVRMVEKEHLFEIVPDQAYDHIDADIARQTISSEHPNFVYFGTLAQRCIASRFALDTCLSNTTCPKFLDLNLRAPWYDTHIIKRSLMRADAVKLNTHELDVISALLKLLGKSQIENGQFLVKKYHLNYLFVTCGHEGAWMITKRGEVIKTYSPPLGNRLVNTIGAGDGFSAICILGLLNGWDDNTILERACQFAAALCAEQGATPAHASFYDAFMTQWSMQA